MERQNKKKSNTEQKDDLEEFQSFLNKTEGGLCSHRCPKCGLGLDQYEGQNCPLCGAELDF